MEVTITEDEWRYDLTYWNSHVIWGVQYEISEEQLNQIKNCQFYEVQSVIKTITLTSKKVWKIFKE